MSRKSGPKKPAASNPLVAAQRSDRNRKIAIQVGVAAVLIGLVAAIGISIALRGPDDIGPIPGRSADETVAQTEENGGDQTDPNAEQAQSNPAVITDNGSVVVGSSDAPVTVRLVEDLQCPACMIFEKNNGQVIADAVAEGTVQVEYNIAAFLDQASTTQYSSRAANASFCVADADVSGYEQWLTTMFAQQPPEGGAGLPDEKLIEIAKAAGYDDPDIATCITEKRYEKYVHAKSQDLIEEGIQGTPTIYINGEQVNPDLQVPNAIKPMIDEAAKK